MHTLILYIEYTTKTTTRHAIYEKRNEGDIT